MKKERETQRGKEGGSSATVGTAPFVVRVGITPFAEYAGLVVYATLLGLLFIHVLVVNDVLGPPNRGRRWLRRVQCGGARRRRGVLVSGIGACRGPPFIHGRCCTSNCHRWVRSKVRWSGFCLSFSRDDVRRGAGLVRRSLGHGRRSAYLGGACDPDETGGRTGRMPESGRDWQRAKTAKRAKRRNVDRDKKIGTSCGTGLASFDPTVGEHAEGVGNK